VVTAGTMDTNVTVVPPVAKGTREHEGGRCRDATATRGTMVTVVPTMPWGTLITLVPFAESASLVRETMTRSDVQPSASSATTASPARRRQRGPPRRSRRSFRRGCVWKVSRGSNDGDGPDDDSRARGVRLRPVFFPGMLRVSAVTRPQGR
jgi:hypothetical protein